MATLTTTPPFASDSPGMLPADRTLEPACGWFVLGTWLFLTVVALGFVTLYGNRTPRWEYWFFVPFIAGAQRVDLAWFWENAQGHGVPIAKLVLCACYSLFGFNSKPILYLNVLLFSALALGLIWAIRKARGRWSYADAFLPIVLLNLGQADAFSWAQTFMVSRAAVAWVVGMGRYAWGNTIFDSRYAAASVVALLGSYFVWELHGPPFLVPPGRMLFFTAAAGFLAANFQLGYLHGRTLRDAERAFLRDLRAAEPIPQLVAHRSWVTYWYHGTLERYLRQLRDAGIPPYNRLPPDPSFQVRTLGPEPTEIVEIDWNGKGGKILGPNAYLRFDPRPFPTARSRRAQSGLVERKSTPGTQDQARSWRSRGRLPGSAAGESQRRVTRTPWATSRSWLTLPIAESRPYRRWWPSWRSAPAIRW